MSPARGSARAKRITELAVAVEDQEPFVPQDAVNAIGQVARDLIHEVVVWVQAATSSGKGPSVLYDVFGDGHGDGFGHAVRALSGDIDDDGIQDLIVGAPQFSASDVGYARTISGANGDVLFTYAPHDGTACNFGCAVAGGSFTGGNRVDVLIGACSYGGGDGIVELWLTVAASAANNGTGWSGTFGVPTFTARTDPVVGRNLGPAREGRCSSTRCSASRSRSPPAA